MSKSASTPLPPYFKFPLIAVGLMLVIKVVYYNLGVDKQVSSNHQIFFHMAFIILSIFLTLHTLDRDPEHHSSFIDDVKDGMKAGVIYALLATSLVVFYYNVVDTGFFAEMQQRVFERSRGEETDLTIEEQREKIKSFFNLTNWTLATLTGYVALSIVYSLLISLFMKVLRRFR